MAVTVSTDTDFKEIISNEDRVAVKFMASWCGQCRLFGPKFKRLSNDERFDGITFLDVNAEENPEARKMAGVNNLPFFAVFQNGELVDAQDTAKEDKVVEMIQKIL